MHPAGDADARGARAARIDVERFTGDWGSAVQRLGERGRDEPLPDTRGSAENQARRQRVAYDGSSEQRDDSAMTDDVPKRHSRRIVSR
jgi:hypothetical protein